MLKILTNLINDRQKAENEKQRFTLSSWLQDKLQKMYQKINIGRGCWTIMNLTTNAKNIKSMVWSEWNDQQLSSCDITHSPALALEPTDAIRHTHSLAIVKYNSFVCIWMRGWKRKVSNATIIRSINGQQISASPSFAIITQHTSIYCLTFDVDVNRLIVQLHAWMSVSACLYILESLISQAESSSLVKQ